MDNNKCLEHYFELIEDLPEECKEMLMTIRELDLAVENAMDVKVKQTNTFLRNAGTMQPSRRESVYKSLMLDFGKILEDAGEKVNVAEKLHKVLVDRLERLDRELAQFKNHLEAEKPGITSAIEERVAKSDAQATDKMATQKRKKTNRKKSSASSSTASSVDEVRAVKYTSKSEIVPVADVPVEAVNKTAVTLNVEATVLTNAILSYDPDQYCICQKASYGDMIACDNASCRYEWFHYACVNVTTAPEGTWYCPTCRMNMVSTSDAVSTH